MEKTKRFSTKLFEIVLVVYLLALELEIENQEDEYLRWYGVGLLILVGYLVITVATRLQNLIGLQVFSLATSSILLVYFSFNADELERLFVAGEAKEKEIKSSWEILYGLVSLLILQVLMFLYSLGDFEEVKERIELAKLQEMSRRERI